MPPTEIHKDTVRMIWTGTYSTLEIVAALQDKYDLGESAEYALSIQVGKLRERVKEAMECAEGAAEQLFREGREWKDVIAALEAPYLIPSGAAVNAAITALEKIAAEK